MGLVGARKRYSFVTFALALILSIPIGANGNFSQRNAQVEANTVSLNGSDRSMELATGSAMSALLSLSSRNIPAALSNGYRAYGEYMDSETLDHRAGEAARKAMGLTSLGTASNEVPGSNRGANKTSFRRLNPDFLYKGETAAIAQKFEAASGMKREVFLEFLAKASETKISPSDPELIQKATKILQDFITQIPNQDFRANLQTTLDAVPSTAKNGIVASAITKTIQMIAASSGNSQSDDGIKAPHLNQELPSTSIPMIAEANEAQTPISGHAQTVGPDMQAGLVFKPLFYDLGINDKANSELNSVFGSAALDESSPSIFTIVSKCYRRSDFFKEQFLASNLDFPKK